MISIVSWLEEWLRTQPEYRMGIQKATVTLNTGGTESGLIINSELFVKESESWQLCLEDWQAVKREAQNSRLTVNDARLIPRDPESMRGVRAVVFANEKNTILANRKQMLSNFSSGSDKERLITERNELMAKAASMAADSAPITLSTTSEIFKRFSAFANDRRITHGKGLTAGTFATTKEDADANVKTGADAVSRYALPNPKPATNVFTISPPIDTELRRGTAQPANAQAGGGVEVIFVKGSPDGTVLGPATIPAK